SLPRDLRDIFDGVSRETMEFSDRINREKEAEYIEKISNKLEMNHVPGDDLIPFRDAVKPVYQYFAEKGILTLDEIQKAREVATDKSIKP
ncbi:hypothetical protein OAF00_00940, partial [bacterium]|nr:hypothetical protein [bacterium]